MAYLVSSKGSTQQVLFSQSVSTDANVFAIYVSTASMLYKRDDCICCWVLIIWMELRVKDREIGQSCVQSAVLCIYLHLLCIKFRF